MKIFKLLGLATTLSLTTVPFVLLSKHEIVRCDYGTPIGKKVEEIKKEVDEIKKELLELTKQGKEHCKKFHELKETLIKLQEQLKYNEKKSYEYSKKFDKLEDKINNSTIATCTTVGGGVALATIPTLVKNKKKK